MKIFNNFFFLLLTLSSLFYNYTFSMEEKNQATTREYNEFLAQQARFHDSTIAPLLKACKEGRTEEVRVLLSNGMNPNEQECPNKYCPHAHETPLMIAAEQGHAEIVQLLLDAHANVDSQDSCKFTALMFAAKKGNREIVNLLLYAGADMNIKNMWNATALIVAASVGQLAVVEQLVQASCDVLAVDAFGNSALYYAHRSVNEAQLNYFLQIQRVLQQNNL